METRNTATIEYDLRAATTCYRCDALHSVAFIDFSVCVCAVCYLSSAAKEYNRLISVEASRSIPEPTFG